MSKQTVVTQLDRLNQLLQHQKIPAFRKTVSSSMNNIKWLRSTLADSADAELVALLALDPKSLLQQHAPDQTPAGV